jgi:hypothetical protein
MKIALILMLCLITCGCARVISENETFGNLKDTYLVITLPKTKNSTNCFPQGYVQVNRIENKLIIDTIKEQTDRMPWESENMIGFSYNKKHGYCKTDGVIVIEPTYGGAIRPFINGLASVMVKDKYYYIDKAGQSIAGPFDWAYDFSDSVGSVKVDGLWGFVNPQGKWAVPPKFTRLDLSVGGYSAVMPDGESGFVNTKGEFIKDGKLGSYYRLK